MLGRFRELGPPPSRPILFGELGNSVTSGAVFTDEAPSPFPVTTGVDRSNSFFKGRGELETAAALGRFCELASSPRPVWVGEPVKSTTGAVSTDKAPFFWLTTVGVDRSNPCLKCIIFEIFSNNRPCLLIVRGTEGNGGELDATVLMGRFCELGSLLPRPVWVWEPMNSITGAVSTVKAPFFPPVTAGVDRSNANSGGL